MKIFKTAVIFEEENDGRLLCVKGFSDIFLSLL